jgi:putative endonuclease
MSRYKTGIYGEVQAVSYLEDAGYVRGEVDIICEKEGTVVFVEVKKRLIDKYGTPLEAITSEKTKEIARVAEHYLYERGLLDKCEVRFDVIGIQKNKIEHIEDVFKE